MSEHAKTELLMVAIWFGGIIQGAYWGWFITSRRKPRVIVSDVVRADFLDAQRTGAYRNAIKYATSESPERRPLKGEVWA